MRGGESRRRVVPRFPVSSFLTATAAAVADTAAADSAPTEPRAVVVGVIPTYRARRSIARVVERALAVTDLVVVVDDACPDRSGELVRGVDPRVHVIVHEVNRGVGGATKTGIAAALALGADYIVKIDADDQMDTAFVPHMIDILEEYPEVELVKGNRFADPTTLQSMPTIRLIGNALLTLMIKFSSGYWTIVDPTNGYIALRAYSLQRMTLNRLAERYFFETDLLCLFGLRRRVIAELEMPAIYGDEQSSLSIPVVLATFPALLLKRFLRRILVNYAIVEINVGSLCAAIGFPLLLIALIFGGHEWSISVSSGIGRPTGTIVFALLLFIIGFQLSLQALLYDVQFSSRTVKLHRDPHHEPAHREPVSAASRRR